jgi:adenylosuccinate lyase
MVDNLMLPGNPRYQPKSLVEIFGYDNLYQPMIEVELAVLEVLNEIGVIPQEDFALLTPEVRANVLQIRTTEVDLLERKVTKHDIRALVRKIQERVDEKLRRWIHVPLTSYDTIETGRVLQFARSYEKVVGPETDRVIGLFADLADKYAGTLQIGRTHGQHAIPITVGFWLATILNRLVYNSGMMENFAFNLVAKISGAVGAHNAVYGLEIASRCGGFSFEDRVLEKIGLKAANISTQIMPPESLAYFLYSCAMTSATLGQMGRDCRHLMRSEIAEIGEPFVEGQVGSSTMAQKRNPITFENTEGMWWRTKNEFGKVMDALISEHQRDLVGSSLARDFPIIIVNLVTQLETFLREDEKTKKPFLERFTVNEENCRRNFKANANVILAEPIYIALQMAGYQGDAHELVSRQAVPLSLKMNQPLIMSLCELAGMDEELCHAFRQIPNEVIDLLRRPDLYIGNATEQAKQIALEAKAYIDRHNCEISV